MKVEKVVEKILSEVKGKISMESGVAGFNGVEEMMEEWNLTLEEIKEKASHVDFDYTKLNKPFIVKDYNFSEFWFLTEFDEDSVQRFVDFITGESTNF